MNLKNTKLFTLDKPRDYSREMKFQNEMKNISGKSIFGANIPLWKSKMNPKLVELQSLWHITVLSKYLNFCGLYLVVIYFFHQMATVHEITLSVLNPRIWFSG